MGGMAEVAEVEADLIGAAGERPGFDQGGAVSIATEHAERRVRLLAIVADFTATEFACFGAHGGIAGKPVGHWVALHAGEIHFFDLATLELRLDEAGKVARRGKDHGARGVPVAAVYGGRHDRLPRGVEDM